MRALNRIFRGRDFGQTKPLVKIINDLWKNGEQGVWYDPSDLSTMFQDASGTLPCYMPGQGLVDPPVGLWLDRRLAASTANIASGAAWSALNSTVSSAVLPSTATSTASSGVFGFTIAGFFNASRINKWWAVDVQWSGNSGGGSVVAQCGNTYTTLGSSTTGTITFYVYPTTASAVAIYTASSAVGQQLTVGMVSIREHPGNHAYQATTTSRPTLSARYNLLTGTEFANGLTDVPFRGGLVSATALAGYAGAIAFGHDGATSSYAYKSDSGSYPQATVSVVVRMDDGSAPMFGTGSTVSNTDFALVVRGVAINPSTYLVTPLPNGCYRVSGSQVATAGSSAVGVVKYNSNSPRTFKVTAFDLRPANDGVGLPPYQRVVDASNYDTTGFPLYLKFDGVDDFLQTASVDFSGTDKVLVSAAMRKLSDAAAALALELSASYSANTGAFAILAPSSAAATTVAFGSKGTASIVATADNFAQAPISVVITGYSEIGNRVQKLRRDGIQKSSSSTDQGVGNYGNYPLYIGRRGGTSNPFGGRLYSLLIRGAATPDSLILKVERYLNQKAKVY